MTKRDKDVGNFTTLAKSVPNNGKYVFSSAPLWAGEIDPATVSVLIAGVPLAPNQYSIVVDTTGGTVGTQEVEVTNLSGTTWPEGARIDWSANYAEWQAPLDQWSVDYMKELILSLHVRVNTLEEAVDTTPPPADPSPVLTATVLGSREVAFGFANAYGGKVACGDGKTVNYNSNGATHRYSQTGTYTARWTPNSGIWAEATFTVT